MRKNILRGTLLILLICTFIIIFGLSNQDAEKSGNLSKGVTRQIINKISNIQKENEEYIIELTEKIIRKIAHFSIYTLVGLLEMAFVSTYKIKEKNRVIVSLLIGVLYAISDEIHQSFIPGRCAQITDIIIDGLGVLYGILILMLIIKIINKIRFKYENATNL